MKKLLLALSVLMGLCASAQNLTLYNMESVPQRFSVNPALDPDCKWYFGTPLLSSYNVGLSTNIIELNTDKYLLKNDNNDSLTFYPAGLFTSFDKNAYIRSDVGIEILNFGFRLHKSFFHLAITNKSKVRMALPGDLFKFIGEGNGGSNLGYQFDFNVGTDVMSVNEYAIGYQRTSLGDRLKLGARLKYVQGLAILETTKNDISLTTDPNSFAYKIKGDIEINAAAPFSLSSAAAGIATPNPEDILNSILSGSNNSGWGLDVGAHFELTERLNFSASVVDLGFVKWQKNTYRLKSKNPGAIFEFKGLDVRELLDSNSGGAQVIMDTIINTFAVDTSSGASFTTGLMGDMYAGATFKIFEKHKAGAVMQGNFYNKEFYPALTLSWNSRFGRVLGLSASYTMMRGNFFNAGLGLSFNAGPGQAYLISDNVVGNITSNVKSINFRVGWNSTFGRKKTQKKKKDGKL